MSKPLINRIFVGSLAAIIAGILLALVTVAAVLCTGTWTFSGSDVTAFEPASAVGWTFGFAIVGGLLFIAGWLGQFVAWIGALVNTARLADKTWFVAARDRPAELRVHRDAGLRARGARRDARGPANGRCCVAGTRRA